MASASDPTDERNSLFLSLLKPVQADCERWAYRLAGNEVDAQDILQQAILSGLTRLGQLRDQSKFRAWMFEIIRTHWKMGLRAGKRIPDPVAPEDLAGLTGGEGEFASLGDQARAVRKLLMQLSPEQAQALWLFEVEGFSSQEIAKILAKNDGAVRVLLLRARERFKALLEKAGISPGDE
jgi:RNA polymerase sigma-70 factor (ECF subfamily)